ncbi:winged helix-turn-helix domain-containing protein [Atlantibacter hermannii]|uniref:winged helix-turn-helix domain-containing protein n=1 Tax=Atlantibacter hermannii TaxID=565 RepID=UPI0028B2400A|nr:winged helix-turn-helix domain-containing protein [Atlantibacter hermannii]
MTIVVNNWRLDPSQNALVHTETGEVRRLGEYHFALLITFISHANNVLSRQYLMAEVWKNRVVGANSLPTAIHALRVALDDNGKQQEIIKTVPKKGYVFSKDFVTEWKDEEEDEAAPAEPFADSPPVAQPASEPPIQQPPQQAPAPVVETPVATPRHTRMIVAIMSAMVLTIAAVGLWLWLRPAEVTPTPSALLKNESYPAADRIMIMHLVNNNLSESNTPSLSHHMGQALDSINQLLTTHQKTATIFYRVTPVKFAMSVLINDQCGVTWQVISSLKNWQGHDRQMGEHLFNSVERTINEMPACHK